MSKKEDEALKIGDFVTFINPKYNGMLSAEGILLPDLVLNTNLSTLDDALFSIHLQRQYSASREYEDCVKTSDEQGIDISDASNQKFLNALIKSRDNETKLNNDYMSKRVGESVRFGDIIQLFHCKSGKYLTVEANILAKNERENMSVALDSGGNPYSWLVVTPRFKIDREGHDREINCSLEMTPWRMNIFQSATDAQQESLVLASQIIYINDPETLSNVAIDEEEVDNADDNSHNFGTLVLRPQAPNAPVDSRALWTLELKAITMGGPIYWRTSQVKIKNVCTGVYLDSTPAYEIDDEGDVVEKYVLNTTSDGTSLGASWNITEPNSTSKMLQNAKAYQISCSGIFFERGEERDDKTYILKGTKEKSTALSLLIHKYSETSAADAAEATIVEPLDRLINFSQGFPISATNIVIGVDKNDPVVKARRQTLLKEQKILDVLLALIFKLKPISERMEKASNATKANPVNFTDEERTVIQMGSLILELCFSLLYYCIQENPENQIYIADNLPVILAHLSSQPLAGKCVTEMLSKNEELQETKITSREIAIFVDKLRSSKMNPMYLQLLQACCSCVGKGVDGNQCKVADMIFENTNDIIIQINADFTKISPANWESTNSAIYVPKSPIPGSPVMGEGLLYNGLPALSLSWTTNSIDFSPLGLFGKLSVNVLELYNADQRAQRSNRNKNKTGVDQKAMVADYFISQMYLGAEMCMDRNYVAMHKLDNLFSFEILATLMKINVTDKLKAAAARLMLCLYVDRDPQASTKIPVLTRTWTEVVKHNEPKLPYVEPQRRYIFALIQQILSEHIEGMAGRRWTDMSKRMLHLLRMLVSFKFYGDMDRMQDVIKPLINAIDRRKVNFNKKPDPTASNSVKASKVVPTDASAKYSVKEESKEEDDETWDDDEDPQAAIEEALKNTWQGRTLTFMDGMPWMLFILSLVAVAVTFTVLSAVSGVEDETGSPKWIVGIAIFVIFVYDLLVRLYCHFYIFSEVWTFLASTFNQIDVVVVLIDVIFLLLTSDGDDSGSAQYSKALRLVRMVRLLRILRAAKVISAIVDLSTEEVITFKEPARFAKAPMYELETMNEMVDILLYAQTVMQDRS
eukprot:GSChrysophyteH1.ASY1.ANO1.1482.1 assembled CDS